MAIEFDGTASYVEATSAVLTAVPMTMACWFYTADVTNNLTLMAISASGATSARFGLQTRGAVAGDPVAAFTQAGASFAITSSTTGYTANTWTHVAGVFTSNASRTVYLNAGSNATNTTSNTPSAAALDRTNVGSSWTGGARVYWPGRVAEVAIWNVALSVEDIAALAKGYRPSLIRPASLRFYSPLVRPIYDARGLSLTDNATTAAVHTARIG